MFVALVSTVVLASSIAMPSVDENPYMGPKGDWAPLQEAYISCGYESNSLFRYICAEKHYKAATNPLTKA